MKYRSAKRTQRKTYATPKLTVHGKVSELTQGGKGKGNGGGGGNGKGRGKSRGHGGSRS
jgi:hypothetical protein